MVDLIIPEGNFFDKDISHNFLMKEVTASFADLVADSASKPICPEGRRDHPSRKKPSTHT